MALLFGISCNLDNVILGMSYGFSNTKISLKNSIFISLICTAITTYCLAIGEAISDFIPFELANIFGAITLIALGIIFIIKEIINKEKNNRLIKCIDLKNILYISLGLSLNNMPIAIASSIGGINILLTAVFSLILSTLFIYIGNIIGKKAEGKYISYLASIILILLGVCSLIF